MTLQTKQVAGGNDHYGQGTGHTAPYTLYRYVNATGKGGCWYSTPERAAATFARSHAV